MSSYANVLCLVQSTAHSHFQSSQIRAGLKMLKENKSKSKKIVCGKGPEVNPIGVSVPCLPGKVTR